MKMNKNAVINYLTCRCKNQKVINRLELEPKINKNKL